MAAPITIYDTRQDRPDVSRNLNSPPPSSSSSDDPRSADGNLASGAAGKGRADPDGPDSQGTGDPCGSGAIFLFDTEHHHLLAVPIRCNRWDCPVCSKHKVRKARALAAAGKPQRILTLTSRPRDGLCTESAVRWFRERFKRLTERIRRNFGHFEYLAFVEFHKSGWPHMHVLTRGCYIPQRTLSKWWQQLTGSHRVYIQAVRNTWKGVQEATKYYLKTARQVAAACPHLPVYTRSRGWDLRSSEDAERPPGSYQFYGFYHGSIADLRPLVEDLGGSLNPLPDDPSRYRIDFPRPPDKQAARRISDVGDFSDMVAVTVLLEVFRDPSNPGSDSAELAAQIEYLTTPEGD